MQAIRQLYGQTLAKELLNVSLSSSAKKPVTSESPADTDEDELEDGDEAEAWSAEAHFTNAHYQSKKMVFLLFINRESVQWY